jgi:hypothetical protein
MEWAAPDSEDVRNLANGADQMDVDWVPEWIPTFSFVNEISCTINKSTFFTNMVDGKYNVHRDLKITVDIGERLDLEEFPFDIQDPTLLFELTHLLEHASIVPFFDANGNPEPLVRLEPYALTLSDFVPCRFQPYCWKLDKTIDQWQKERSAIKVQIFMERSFEFYLYNTYAIFFLLSASCACAWAIAPEPASNGRRMGFDKSILLTFIAFKFVLNNSLPPVSYMTLLDKYIFQNFLFIFAILFAHALQTQVEFSQTAEGDTYLLLAFAAWWVILQLSAVTSMLRARRRRRIECLDSAKSENMITGDKMHVGRKEMVLLAQQQIRNRSSSFRQRKLSVAMKRLSKKEAQAQGSNFDSKVATSPQGEVATSPQGEQKLVI